MLVFIDLLATKAGQVNVPRFYTAEIEKLILVIFAIFRGEARQKLHEVRRGEADF